MTAVPLARWSMPWIADDRTATGSAGRRRSGGIGATDEVVAGGAGGGAGSDGGVDVAAGRAVLGGSAAATRQALHNRGVRQRPRRRRAAGRATGVANQQEPADQPGRADHVMSRIAVVLLKALVAAEVSVTRNRPSPTPTTISGSSSHQRRFHRTFTSLSLADRSRRDATHPQVEPPS